MEHRKVGIYARISTNDKGQYIDMQINELTDYAKRRDWPIYKVYQDIASGSKDENQRPGLKEMLKDAKRRRFDIVIVYRFDRFARSLKQLIMAIEEFHSLGIEFISLHEGIDTSTPTGKLTFHILGALAEFERDVIRERVKSGLAAARARGVVLGAKPKHVHYRAEIKTRRQAGETLRKIAKELGIGLGTVSRLERAVLP